MKKKVILGSMMASLIIVGCIGRYENIKADRYYQNSIYKLNDREEEVLTYVNKSKISNISEDELNAIKKVAKAKIDKIDKERRNIKKRQLENRKAIFF